VAAAGYLLYRVLAARRPKEPLQALSSARDSATDAGGIAVFFGSQTGTAEAFATELHEELVARGATAVAEDLENFEGIEDLNKRDLCIFIMATYGEGDPTDNAMNFCHWIKKQEKGCLAGRKYAVMGCGNKQYVHFNGIAKLVFSELQRLGMAPICELGLGDDDADIEEDFSKWKEVQLFPVLEQMNVGKASNDTVLTAESISRSLPLVAEVGPESTLPVDASVQGKGVDVVSKGYFTPPRKVLSVTELRQSTAGGLSTVQVDLEIPGVSYETADTADILPENDPGVVEHFAKILSVDLDNYVALMKNPHNNNVTAKKLIPTPCSIRTALARYCDLLQIPGKSTLRNFAAYCNAEDEANVTKLLESSWALKAMSTGEVHLSFGEYLQLFMPSLKMDLGAFLQLCPRQRPRSFTISSSPAENKKVVSVTVGLVKKALPSLDQFLAKLKSDGITYHTEACGILPPVSASRGFQGVASSFLCFRSEQISMVLNIHKSSFSLPQNATCPIIMVGAGTGVAPFRGFLREMTVTQKHRESMLIFGCQKRDVDNLYMDEFAEATKSRVLTHLVYAFSREQEKKVYVQHRVSEHAKDIKRMFDDGAIIYICGATAMGEDVKKALAPICGKKIEDLRGSRIIEELWG
jgi:NADPH-ferrihemoprotein reductase